MTEDGEPLRLFQAYGVEIEYMLVDRETLAVRPLSDELLKAVIGEYACDYEDGPVAWSNELALHLIELKTNGPTGSLSGWAARFDRDVRRINALLEKWGAVLLPGGMHPSMDPRTETRLWPHEYSEVYNRFHRIFDCHRHGWANLQSVHLNLPFRGDLEFGRLHAACRAVLPVLPAIAASSPAMDGRATGRMDNRLHVYCTHQARIQSAMGSVIPEPVFTRRQYEERILEPMYREIAPNDPEGILQHEFLNARGAIARFERSAIEIRLMDVQEHPGADLALALLATGLVRALAEERWCPIEQVSALDTLRLRRLLDRTIADADRAELDDVTFLSVFGLKQPLPADQFWRHALEAVRRDDPDWKELSASLELILTEGPLARRLSTAYGPDPSRERIEAVHRELIGCLGDARPFHAG